MVESKSINVLFLNERSSAERVPLYAALSHTPGWHFQVISTGRSETGANADQPWQMKRRPEVDGSYLPGGLWQDLRRIRPNVIITSSVGWRSVTACAFAKFSKSRLVFFSYDTPALQRQYTMLQRLQYGFIRRTAHAFIAVGQSVQQAFIGNGVPGDKIIVAGNGVEIAETDVSREQCRGQLGISGFCCLSVGSLTAGKGLAALLAAWAEFEAAAGYDIRLNIVGDGPERTRLEEMAQELKLATVTFTGRLSEEQTQIYLGAADLYIIPAEADAWGTGINKVLACGLPLICSRYSGCVQDLVEPGRNGWVTDPRDTSAFSRQLQEAYASRQHLPAMGERSKEIIRTFTVNKMASAIVQAVYMAIGEPVDG